MGGKRQSIRGFLWLVLQGKRFGTKRPAVQIRPARHLSIRIDHVCFAGLVPRLRPARHLSIRIDHVCFAGALRFLRPARLLSIRIDHVCFAGALRFRRPAPYFACVLSRFHLSLNWSLHHRQHSFGASFHALVARYAQVQNYYTEDILGSTLQEIGPGKSAEQTYQYTAYSVAYSGSLSDANQYGYTGKQFDPVVGLSNYGFRDYNPQRGAWTTQDPIQAGLNWYAYVNEDPVNWVDPLGLNKSYLVAASVETAAYGGKLLETAVSSGAGEEFAALPAVKVVTTVIEVAAITLSASPRELARVAKNTVIAVGSALVGGFVTGATLAETGPGSFFFGLGASQVRSQLAHLAFGD